MSGSVGADESVNAVFRRFAFREFLAGRRLQAGERRRETPVRRPFEVRSGHLYRATVRGGGVFFDERPLAELIFVHIVFLDVEPRAEREVGANFRRGRVGTVVTFVTVDQLLLEVFETFRRVGFAAAGEAEFVERRAEIERRLMRIRRADELDTGQFRLERHSTVLLQPNEIERDAFAANLLDETGETLRIFRFEPLRNFERFVLKARRFVQRSRVEPIVRRRAVNAEINVRLFDRVRENVEITSVNRNEFRRVITGDELVDERFRVERRVPKEFRDHPSAELNEVARFRLIVALFEEPDDVVIDVKIDVRVENAVVRERKEVKGEVGNVVPNEELVGDFAPAFDVFAERLILFRRKGLRERTLDRAKPNNDVVARTSDLRRLAGVLVGERFDVNVRELFLDRFRDLVDAVKERTGGRAVFFVDFAALFALAVAAPVVLTDREERRLGVFAQRFERVFRHLGEHFVVRETKLRPGFVDLLRFQFRDQFGVTFRRTGPSRPTDLANAVDFREPFRVFAVIFRRRNQLISGVNEVLEAVAVAELFRRGGTVAVALEPRRENAVARNVAIKRVAIFEFRRVSVIEFVDFNDGALRNGRFGRRPPTDAEARFEELVNGVKGAALGVPGQDDRVADALHNDTVVVEFRLVDRVAEEFLRKRAGADDDKLRVGFAGGVFFGEDREFDAGRLREVGAQFVRGGLLDGSRSVRKNDRVIGATVFRQNEVGGEGRRGAGSDQERERRRDAKERRRKRGER